MCISASFSQVNKNNNKKKVYHQEYGYKYFKHTLESVYWEACLHLSSTSFQLRIIIYAQSVQRNIACKLTGWLQTVTFQMAISEDSPSISSKTRLTKNIKQTILNGKLEEAELFINNLW